MRALNAFFDKELSLRQIILDQPFSYFLDFDNALDPLSIVVVSTQNIPKNYLPEDQIRSIAALYQKGEAVEGELVIIGSEEAEKTDYNLSPSRWVGQSESASGHSLVDLIDKSKSLAEMGRQVDEKLFAMLSKVIGS